MPTMRGASSARGSAPQLIRYKLARSQAVLGKPLFSTASMVLGVRKTSERASMSSTTGCSTIRKRPRTIGAFAIKVYERLGYAHGGRSGFGLGNESSAQIRIPAPGALRHVASGPRSEQRVVLAAAKVALDLRLR